jgi:hypothetical protein
MRTSPFSFRQSPLAKRARENFREIIWLDQTVYNRENQAGPSLGSKFYQPRVVRSVARVQKGGRCSRNASSVAPGASH